MKPYYTLSIDGNAITLHNRSINMQVIDKNGMEADELTIELDDHDGKVELPSRGQVLGLSFGYDGGAVYVGRFTVDEVSHKGPPDVITIRASSADFRQTLLTEREQSYDSTTVGGILTQIAGRQGLKLAVSSELGSIVVTHIDQTNESDANLITRLATEHDAVGTIKDGKLIFIPRATGKAASGKTMSGIIIKKADTQSHDFSEQDRQDKVGTMASYYQDKKTGKRIKVQTGGGGTTHHLKQTYHSKDEAINAAKGKLKKTKTAGKTLTLSLSLGRPELTCEMSIKTSGFKSQIDGIDWIITEVTHTLNNQQGLNTQIDCEQKY